MKDAEPAMEEENNEGKNTKKLENEDMNLEQEVEKDEGKQGIKVD